MKLDPKKTAVLTLDIQEGIMGFVPGAEAIIPNAAQVVAIAKKAGFLTMHVGIGFDPGYPELSSNNPRFLMIKERGMFAKGSDSAKIHKGVFTAGDPVIYKHRVSAFAGNSLLMILRSQKIENLVLMGIATSGIVLSTLRQAFDLDFTCIVIKDACFDADPEVHRVLTEKVFANQATVITAKIFETEFVSS